MGGPILKKHTNNLYVIPGGAELPSSSLIHLVSEISNKRLCASTDERMRLCSPFQKKNHLVSFENKIKILLSVSFPMSVAICKLEEQIQ
jgi:hypothetical protein